MSSRAPTVLVLTFLALAAAGCGLKGPLYLPDERKEQVGTPATTGAETQAEAGKKNRGSPPVPAPQSQKEPPGSDTTDSPSTSPQTPVTPPDPDRPANVDPVQPPGR